MTTPTLTSVQADFRHWRTHKPHLRSPVPSALREKALSLLGQHSVHAICQALGITRQMLRGWQQPAEREAPAAMPPVEFITLDSSAMPPQDEHRPLQVSLTQANGDQWCLQGDLSAGQLQAFVCALSGAAR